MLVLNTKLKWIAMLVLSLFTNSQQEHYNCKDKKLYSIDWKDDKRILDSIKATASKISREAINCQEMFRKASKELELLFRSSNHTSHHEDENSDDNNATVYTDFFNSLKMLIARATELRKKRCTRVGGTFDEVTAVCSTDNRKTPSHPSHGTLFYFQVVGNSLSITSLGVLLCMLLCFEELKTVPGRYIKHLVVVLASGHALLLAKHYATTSARLCAAVGICLHWAYLTVFCMMAMIALSTTRTFCQPMMTSQCEKFRRYRLAVKTAYGFPLLIITPCTMIHFVNPKQMSYGGNGECFISNARASIAAFVVPVGCALLFNCVCLVVAVSKIHRASKENRRVLQNGNLGNVLRAQSTIMVLRLGTFTGIGWIFGFIDGFTGIEAFQWVFEILCSLQGFCVFAAFAFTTRSCNLLLRKIKEKMPRNKTSLDKNPGESRLTPM